MFKVIILVVSVLATGAAGIFAGLALRADSGLLESRSGSGVESAQSMSAQDASASGGKNSTAPLGQHALFGAPLLTTATATSPDRKGSVHALLLATSDEPGAPRIVVVIGSSYRGQGAVQLSYRAKLISANEPASLAAPIDDELKTETGSFKAIALSSKPWLEVNDDREISILFESAAK
jgi:hypothetical protein